MRNPYEVLGVDPKAELKEIKAAYKRKAQAAHPDREGGSAEEMESLTWAWGILQDVDKRAFWDAFGAELGPEGLAGEGKREAERALLSAVDLSGNMLQHARQVILDRQEAGSLTIRHLEASRKRAEGHLKRLSGGSGRVQSAISGGIEAIQKEIAKEQWINRVMSHAMDELSQYGYQEESLNDQWFLTKRAQQW